MKANDERKRKKKQLEISWKKKIKECNLLLFMFLEQSECISLLIDLNSIIGDCNIFWVKHFFFQRASIRAIIVK